MHEREHHRRRDKRENYDLDERIEPENIVKSYPSIPYAITCDEPIVAFDKLDGSNVRAEWNKKKGWFKFGTRNRLVDISDPIFGKVPQIIVNKYGENLAKALQDNGYERAMCFFEFYGPSSFAGMHDLKEEQTVTLFDVAPFKRGILTPELFLKQFGHLDVPKVLWFGVVVDDEFIESVRESLLKGMTFEGVVCKSVGKSVMFKQKTKKWLNKLKEHCGENRNLYNALM